MIKRYKLDGKYILKKDIPKTAKRVNVIKEEHYESEEYIQERAVHVQRFFKMVQELRDQLEERHG